MAAHERQQNFGRNFLLGGISAATAETVTAPIGRVKLLLQSQDANPRILSGEALRYRYTSVHSMQCMDLRTLQKSSLYRCTPMHNRGITDCFARVAQEQGLLSFWRGNLTNCIRYFPTQAFNFAFKDSIRASFPQVDPVTQFGKFFLMNMASGSVAGAASLAIVYPLDYARTRLAADVGRGKRTFTGLTDCLVTTATGPKGVLGLYNGFTVSVIGITLYR
jgi:solute carrier family 25 (mitochondrial adenine nucleotide translocator), member 4/5/6/31